MNKFLGFYYEALTLDGQRCNYVGTAGELLKSQFVNVLLIAITFGIYTPWALVNLKKWTYANVEVGGQRGRLTFDGDGGTLFGTYLLGAILSYCTFGIYGAWLANDIFAFYWDNTKLDGRGFSFKKDPGGFLGTYILTVLLSMCTLYIYLPGVSVTSSSGKPSASPEPLAVVVHPRVNQGLRRLRPVVPVLAIGAVLALIPYPTCLVRLALGIPARPAASPAPGSRSRAAISRRRSAFIRSRRRCSS